MPSFRCLRSRLGLMVVSCAVVSPLLAAPPSQAAHEGAWDDVDRAASDPTSYVTLIGDYDDFVTDGTQRLWQPEDTIEIGGRADGAVVVRVGGDHWDSYKLVLRAPAGETLTAGFYPIAGGLPGPSGQAGFTLSGQQRGCTQGNGSLTVHDITPDLSRLWVSFEVTCEAITTVRGEVRIDSPLPPTQPLTVLTDAVRWRVSPPGREYGTQPVFAINHGDEPIVVGPAEVTGDAFSLAGSSCGLLLPGASCAFEIAFDPLTRETEEGLLRATTSSSAQPLVEVPLTGVGNVGITDLLTRTVAPDGRISDTEMSSDVEMWQAFADPRRITIAYPHPDYIHERPNGRVMMDFATFEAAPGDQLEAGRTYRATCFGEGGARLELGSASCSSAATGSFIVDELELRADNTLARLRVRARLNRDEDSSSTTTTIVWQADEPATPYVPAVELKGPSRLSRAGTIDLSATLPAGFGVVAVDLYATTARGRVLLGTFPTRDDSTAVLSTYLRDDTTLVAQATTENGVIVSSEPLTVTVEDLNGPSTPPGGAGGAGEAGWGRWRWFGKRLRSG